MLMILFLGRLLVDDLRLVLLVVLGHRLANRVDHALLWGVGVMQRVCLRVEVRVRIA